MQWAAAVNCRARRRSCSSRPNKPASVLRSGGPQGLQERLAAVWTAFLARIDDAERPWMTVVTSEGREAVEQCYAALLDGTVPASEGHILSV